ncbi:alcohol dehydrogenase catalytic domain-containing protein [Mucilaginibacter sp. UC70_90]
MKAFIIDKYKSKDGGRIGQMPDPEPQGDEVLIEVHAAGINLLDSKMRSGEFKLILPYKTPFVLGHDVAGVITKVGARVHQFKSRGRGLCTPGRSSDWNICRTYCC